jgi:hypothetical protein
MGRLPKLKTIVAEKIRGVVPLNPAALDPPPRVTRICPKCLQRPSFGLSDLRKECRAKQHPRGRQK